MIKYKNKRTTITIDLPEECGHEGYSVDCSYFYDKNEKQYLVSMELFRNDIKDKQLIDSQYINGDENAIEFNIRHIVEYASMSGYFEKYIQKYEYTYKCFDKGNDFFETDDLDENKSYPVKECEIIRIAYHCTKCGIYVEEGHECCPHCNAKLNWNNIKRDTDNDL